MSANIIGLDIGGANLKAATAGGQARSVPFQLWKHPERLPHALRELLLGWQPGRLAVTMTGELCDCFNTKRDGVRAILAGAAEAFPAVPLAVWTTRGRFATVRQANEDHLAVAAANWHALASYVGRFLSPPDVSRLLIDVGSTTADIIPITKGSIAAAGRTDVERLRTGELVYTGVRRTPVCALINIGVASELFATTHDVYLLLEKLPDDPDERLTADARPATREHAHARLARMLGGDGETVSQGETIELACRVFARQRQMLSGAIRKIAAGLPEVDEAVFAGSGEFLARAAWEESGFESRQLSLAESLGPDLSGAACAYAVARLLEAA